MQGFIDAAESKWIGWDNTLISPLTDREPQSEVGDVTLDYFQHESQP